MSRRDFVLYVVGGLSFLMVFPDFFIADPQGKRQKHRQIIITTEHVGAG